MKHLIIIATCTAVSLVSVVTYFESEKVSVVERQVRAEKLRQETEAAKLLQAKQSLLSEYDTCMMGTERARKLNWIEACNTHPEERRSDGMCHTLPMYLVHQVESQARDDKDRCENSYRNQMQALGVRQ